MLKKNENKYFYQLVFIYFYKMKIRKISLHPIQKAK